MTKKLLARIREIYLQKLLAKTGWGRNELIAIYDQSVSEALMEMVDENA